MSKEGHQHHLMFPKKLHKAQEPTKYIREIRWLKPPLDEEVHNELHRNVSMVAVGGYLLSQRIAHNFVPKLYDYLGSLDNLAFAIEEAAHHHKTPEMERKIGEVMLEGVVAQRVYVVEGLILPEEVA